jgi:hypothetical protein
MNSPEGLLMLWDWRWILAGILVTLGLAILFTWDLLRGEKCKTPPMN